MRILMLALLAVLLTTYVPAFAEGGCPQGQMPMNISAPLGSAQSLVSCTPIPTSPGPHWATRWGAIASDSSGEFGIATGLASERAARKAALAECAKRGGVRCNASFTFYNQCAAVASSESISFSQGAATEQEAKDLALRKCKDASAGRCWIYYSGCSLPVRVR